MAIETYISYVDKSPCGSTVINLYKGSTATDFIAYRNNLKVFLKGTKKKKTELKRTCPTMFDEFAIVWGLRNKHMASSIHSLVLT